MTIVDTFINERYPIRILEHRAKFHSTRPTWEATRLASMHDLLQPGWTVYDVGAEEGDFTALYRGWVGDTGTVVAVEPSTCYWPAIRKTWEENGFAGAPICVTAFAGDRTYFPQFSDHFTQGDYDQIILGPNGWPVCSAGPIIPDCGFRALCERTLDTPGWRLDDLADAYDAPPNAITMDIEGAEWHALSGCERLVAPGGPQPLIWVSVHDENMINAYGKQFSDIIRLVLSWDYTYEYVGCHGGEDFWLFGPAGAL
jgi:FkbM family methyltransferase